MATKRYEDEFLEREFEGYGMEPPNPEWPGEAKVCVSFVVQYYMGAVSGSQSAALDTALTTNARNLRYSMGMKMHAPTSLRFQKQHRSRGGTKALSKSVNVSPAPFRSNSACTNLAVCDQMYEYGAREGVSRLLSLFNK